MTCCGWHIDDLSTAVAASIPNRRRSTRVPERQPSGWSSSSTVRTKQLSEWGWVKKESGHHIDRWGRPPDHLFYPASSLQHACTITRFTQNTVLCSCLWNFKKRPSSPVWTEVDIVTDLPSTPSLLTNPPTQPGITHSKAPTATKQRLSVIASTGPPLSVGTSWLYRPKMTLYRNARDRLWLSHAAAEAATTTVGHTVCAKKVTPFWYLSFLPLLDALYLQFLFTYVSFSLNAWYQSQVSSVEMDSSARWCTIAHYTKNDKLPQRGECFIHRASDVASKQPWFKPRWLCCLRCSSAARLP